MSRKNANEGVRAALVHLADRMLQRYGRTILSPADDLSDDADDPPLPGFQIFPQVLIVLVRIGGRHQHLDILADHLVGLVAEQPLTGTRNR